MLPVFVADPVAFACVGAVPAIPATGKCAAFLRSPCR